MAACSAAPVAILRDGRPSKSAVADFDTLGCRSRAGPTSVGGLLRMRSESFLPPSVQRFHFDDGCAVIVADPERARALRIVDMDTPNIGRMRQLIFRVL